MPNFRHDSNIALLLVLVLIVVQPLQLLAAQKRNQQRTVASVPQPVQLSDQAAAQFDSIQNEMQNALGVSATNTTYAQIQSDIANFANSQQAVLAANPEINFRLNKMKRIAVVQENLQKCLKDFSKNSLGQRILGMAYSLKSTQIGCLNGIISPTKKSLGESTAAMQAAILKSVQSQMGTQVKVNAATNLADVNYRLIDSLHPSTDGNVDQIVAALCSSGCTADEKNKIRAAAAAHVSELAGEGVQPVGISAAKDMLNARVNDLNSITDQSFKATDKNQAMIKAQMEYQNYSDAYWRASSDGLGLLFLTDSISSKSGNLSSFQGSTATKTANMYTLKVNRMHAEIDPQDVTAARAEYTKEMTSMASDINRDLKATSIDDVRSSVKDMIRNNPLAAAQLLVSDPSYTKVFCDLINELDADKAHTAKVSHLRSMALMITGGTLTVVGIGITAVGVTAAFTGIGVPLAAVLTPVGWGVTAAGTALSATELGFSIHDYYSSSAEVEQIARASLSGNADQKMQAQQAQLRGEVSDAAVDIAKNAAFTAVGLGTLLRTARTAAAALGRSSSLADNLTSMETVVKQAPMQWARGQMSEGQFADLVGNMTNLSGAERDTVMKTLIQLQQSGATPEELDSISKGISYASIGCAG